MAPHGARVFAFVNRGDRPPSSSSANGGIQLYLQGDNGVEYFYAHLSGYAVSTGTRVRAGQLIAYNGQTGTPATRPPRPLRGPPGRRRRGQPLPAPQAGLRLSHQARLASRTRTGAEKPLSSRSPSAVKRTPSPSTAAATGSGDQDLPGLGAGGDPGGQVDGAAGNAALDDHRPGGHADVGRGEAGLGDLADHGQGGRDRVRRFAEVQHHPVAQPLHRGAAVGPRGALDQQGQGLGGARRRPGRPAPR